MTKVYEATRVCKVCSIEKSIQEFRLIQDKRSHPYRCAVCKDCINAKRRAKREETSATKKSNKALRKIVNGKEIERICTTCGLSKSIEEFYRRINNRPNAKPHRLRRCSACCQKASKAYREADPTRTVAYKLSSKKSRIKRLSTIEGWCKSKLNDTRSKAKKNNIPFTMTAEDIIDIFPKDYKCPALNIQMVIGSSEICNPINASLDKIFPILGYTPKNIAIISLRANMIKNNADSKTILKVGMWVKTEEERIKQNQQSPIPAGLLIKQKRPKERTTIEQWSLDCYYRIKEKAINNNIKFEITPDDIAAVFPKNMICPVLNTPLEIGSINNVNPPSLDKVLPELGYISINLAVISYRANRIKHNATADEIISVGNWVKSIGA